MHNLAIALHKKGYQVTGSDDEIVEPSKSRLASYQLLPAQEGWNEAAITPDLKRESRSVAIRAYTNLT
jgi:UDP-N-acetylmuramate: L-alanyl-gamma-D-glutamyl-meso-diaminopimelate ligase